MSRLLESVNGRFRIGTRIGAGFALVLVLVVLLGVSGWRASTETQSSFEAYSTITVNKMRIDDVEADFNSLRRQALIYANTGDAAARAQIDKLDATIRKDLETSTVAIVSEDRRQIARAILASHVEYTDNLRRLIQLRGQRDAAVEQGMNKIGSEVWQEVTVLLDRSIAANDFRLAAYLGKVQENLGLARIDALHFVAKPDPATLKATDDALGALAADIDRAIAQAAPDNRAQIEKVRGSAARYRAAVGTASQSLGAIDELVNTTNAAIAVKLADQIELLKTKQGEATVKIAAEAAGTVAGNARTALVLAGAALLLGAVISLFVARGITRPVGEMTVAMRKLAEGDLTADVPGKDNKDEIGEMAQTVLVFKDNAVKVKALEVKQREIAERAEIDKKAAVTQLADAFEREIGGVVAAVATSASDLQGAATQMSATAEETNRQATAVAAASEEASTNVQTVASAAEELSSSIAEISRQVAESARITSRAVDDVAHTGTTVEALAQAAQKIGDVVKLISDIASQTNLLALNATIEAARAGDAGKGFAVVASEVKNLASQTARATEDIGSQIAAIQTATGQSVEAMRKIGATISRMNEVASSIASAVEEQGAATAEIARNVQQAAAGTGEVSSNIVGVTKAAGESGESATRLQVSASALGGQSTTLRDSVAGFMAKVRAG